MFREMGQTRENIIRELIQLSYYMRGGLQYEDAYQLNKIERSHMSKFLDERIEQELKNRQHPNY